MTVKFAALDGPTKLSTLAQDLPDVYVIDLERLPAQGREVGLWLRRRARTRPVPLVFAGGATAKVARVKRLLPDASFCDWGQIGPAVGDALAAPPSNPIVPQSGMAGYSGTPLPRKLGIKQGSVVAVLGPPPEFEQTLGPLPRNVRLVRRQGPSAGLTIWFCRSRADLESNMETVRDRLGSAGRLWIAWPKKSSGVQSDISQAQVRAAGLDCGLVDFKICAIDATWSGLQFAPRRD